MQTTKIAGILAGTALGTVLTLGLAGGAAFAQTKVHDGTHFGGIRSRMAQRLGLSENQRTQIRAIKEASHARAKAIWADDKQSVGSLKAQLKSLREETKSKIEAVLTPDQKSKIATAKGKMKERGGQRFSPPNQL